jgi:hypothetical protein
MARLRAPGLQKGKLLKLLSALPLRHLPSTLSIGCHVIQAVGILLSQISDPALHHKLVLKEALCILAS